jgi:uncharacterized protein YndB with AHSA1/START domain
MTEPAGSFITRTFAAPVEAVFDAWVTPASFAAWFGGSGATVPVESVTMDARPGGSWTATMILGAGMPDMNWIGDYVEVDRPHKLVLTIADRPGDARETITVTFAAVDGGTLMTFSQTGGNLSPEQYEATTVGWNGFFDALASLL